MRFRFDARCEDCQVDLGPGGPPLCSICLCERNLELLRRQQARRGQLRAALQRTEALSRRTLERASR